MIRDDRQSRVERAFADGTPIDDAINEGVRDAMIATSGSASRS